MLVNLFDDRHMLPQLLKKLFSTEVSTTLMNFNKEVKCFNYHYFSFNWASVHN